MDQKVENNRNLSLDTSDLTTRRITTTTTTTTGIDYIQYSLDRTIYKYDNKWTAEDDEKLLDAIDAYGDRRWRHIAEVVGTKNNIQCRQRWQNILRPGIKKGKWAKQEDTLLRQAVMSCHAAGIRNWRRISEKVPSRTAKQCRERWSQYLCPEVLFNQTSVDLQSIPLSAHDDVNDYKFNSIVVNTKTLGSVTSGRLTSNHPINQVQDVPKTYTLPSISSIQSLQAIQTLQAMQTLQSLQATQTLQSLQTIQSIHPMFQEYEASTPITNIYHGLPSLFDYTTQGYLFGVPSLMSIQTANNLSIPSNDISNISPLVMNGGWPSFDPFILNPKFYVDDVTKEE